MGYGQKLAKNFDFYLDVSPISRRHIETITVTIIWKPGFKLISTLSMHVVLSPSDEGRRSKNVST